MSMCACRQHLGTYTWSNGCMETRTMDGLTPACKSALGLPCFPLALPGRPEILRRPCHIVGTSAWLGRHYLSNATCLIRHHVFYALFIVSGITIICKKCSPLLRKTCFRQAMLDKWFPLTCTRERQSTATFSPVPLRRAVT